jgi:hypothetical protein
MVVQHGDGVSDNDFRESLAEANPLSAEEWRESQRVAWFPIRFLVKGTLTVEAIGQKLKGTLPLVWIVVEGLHEHKEYFISFDLESIFECDILRETGSGASLKWRVHSEGFVKAHWQILEVKN